MIKKIALVTGGTRGIGKEITSTLAKSGYITFFTYKSNEKLAFELESLLNNEKYKVYALQLTLNDRQGFKKILQKITSKYGSIDILINNAAIAQEKPFETITDSDWSNMLSINLQGPFVCCQEVIPIMQKNNWGRIINISSIGGQWGGYNQVHYAAAKAGLINLTKSLSKIYSKFGITTNAIAIGLIATDMSSREISSSEGKAKIRSIPVGRLGSKEEVANLVKFLASEESSYVTGQTINLNGGMYLS